MRITSIDYRCQDMALSRPYAIASHTVTSVSNVIVVMQSDSGTVGLGAASPEPLVTGETLEACAAGIAAQAPQLVGRDALALISSVCICCAKKWAANVSFASTPTRVTRSRSCVPC